MSGLGSPVSIALVVGQLALIALLASPLEGLVPGSARQWLGLAVVAAGIVLALLAARAMRATRFSVLPEPRAGGTLVRRGPYRLVRHPMYAAVLLYGVGAALAHGDARHGFWLVLLAVVLWLKIRREERLLIETYPDYASYRERVRAIVPGLL